MPSSVRKNLQQQRETIEKIPAKHHRDDLLDRLADPTYSAQYLKAALDETLEDGNMEAFILAISNIVEARSQAEETTIDPTLSQHHLQQLDNSDRSTLATLATLLNSVGLAIDVKPV